MTKQASLPMRVFGVVWRTIAVLYGLLTLVVLVAMPITLYVVYAGADEPIVKPNSALVWMPRGTLIEQRDVAVPGLVGPLLGRSDPESVVSNLVTALDRAADDPRIELAFLKLGALASASAGQLEELAAAIERFQESGKRVIAWAPSYSQAQYRLAAHADKVFLDPMGWVFVNGFGVYRKYFAEALDMLGVNIHVFRVGKYKSFVEPFVRNSMSPQARAANQAWLQTLWRVYVQSVSANRDLPPGAVREYVRSFGDALARKGGRAAEVAVKAGLVDELATIREVHDYLRQFVAAAAQNEGFRKIGYRDYLRATDDEQPPPATDSDIALVVVEGPIVMGRSMPGAAGAKTIAAMIERVRRNDHAAALVLRINSPGGSVFASERIRRQVELVRKAGKPVVVSMAGVAASGGYWIAMNANRIYALKSTITGSIGVFAIVPTIGKTLAKIGVHTDGIGTTPLSGAFRIGNPLQPPAKRILRSGVQQAYRSFITKVAKARGMTVEAVNQIARGRVWSGADARRIGLVDKIGGLNEAIAAAAELAGLDRGDYEVDMIRPQRGWQALLFQVLRSRARMALVPEWLGRFTRTPAFNWLRYGFDDPRNLYALCLCQPAG